MNSYLFRGATVVDGSGSPPQALDVAVRSGRITAVGPCLREPEAERIDVSGLVLAPGFIDIHGHSDISVFRHHGAESKLFQGVTTEVTGNCGLSAFPVASTHGKELAEYLKVHEYILPEEPLPFCSFDNYARSVEGVKPGINHAPLVGHAALRIAVMGMEDRAPTTGELAAMSELLRVALEQGAWGLSTGLIYPPGSYAATEELIALARMVANYGGLCTSHIRSEGDGLMAALEEAAAIAAESGVRMQVSHLKALGRNNRGRGPEVLSFLASARQRGIDIAADQYPYDASATSLTAVLPAWALAGGVTMLLQRLADQHLRERLRSDIGFAIAQREGAEGIVVTCRTEMNRQLSGLSLASIAHCWRCSPEDAVMRLLLEEQGEVGAIFFCMASEDVATILSDPLVAVGSDGHGLTASAAGDATHPRSYGCFPRVIGRYVREKKLLDLATAIRKMTALPAGRIGLPDRGLIRPGYVADLTIFDPERITDVADYVDPHRYSTGIVHVYMEGRPVIENGNLTGPRIGRVLRRQPQAKEETG
ncbi:amidohydrolase family protein [Geobacter sp. DSM 9736]|uniref:N-acyl-D-amino-acid deacylase family protein n=1 Tax=Geobacter sp. DSM 9736 TaxID=1277350 RepID=UPI000B50FD01|nr:D-aminoacylase [Geobacter sp. DSM 9736]SNB45592.1 N-acyl-D-amino-acid deacylase [Geobacter sp. DSM 9736]